MGKREQKAKATKEAIFAAAAKVIGRVGYAKASMAAIAIEAGVSYGGIYLYFENQQDLFNKLLPHIGEEMLHFIAEQSKNGRTTAERERLGLYANFEYLTKHPELHRVLNEAAFFAPESYHAYFKRMVDGYQRSLRKGILSGELPDYSEDETRTLALMFIGAREYFVQQFAVDDLVIEFPPESVMQTYLKAYALALGFDPKTAFNVGEASDGVEASQESAT